MKKAKMRPGYKLTSLTAYIAYRVLFGLRCEGLENVPLTGSILLVSNHVSNFDPPLIGATIPREIAFAAKIELFKGLIGKFIRYLNSVPVRRHGSDKEAIRLLTEKLKEGYAVLIFPEGTRTLDPAERVLKAGVGMLAVKGEADLLPIRVEGTNDLKKAFFRKQRVVLKVGKPVKTTDIIQGCESRKEAYTKISEIIMQEIAKLGDS